MANGIGLANDTLMNPVPPTTQGGGIGLAPVTVTPRQVASPAAPSPIAASQPQAQQAPQVPQVSSAGRPRNSIPQFKDNPIGALGVVLQEVGAGLQGKPSPLDAKRKADLVRQGLELQFFSAGMEISNALLDKIDAIPEADRQAFIDNSVAQLPESMQTGVRAALETGVKLDAAERERDIEFLKSNPMLAAGIAKLTGGDPRRIKSVADTIRKAELETIERAATLPGRVKEEKALSAARATEVKSVERIFNEARASAAGAQAGKPESRRFVEIDGVMKFETDESIVRAREGGATIKPVNSAESILSTLLGGAGGGGSPTPVTAPPLSAPVPANLRGIKGLQRKGNQFRDPATNAIYDAQGRKIK